MEDCVRREVLEETNLEIEDIEFVSMEENIFSTHRPEKHFLFLNYRVNAKEGSVILNGEHSEYILTKPEKALKNLSLYFLTITHGLELGFMVRFPERF